MGRKNTTNIPSEQENPLFHDTWKLLKNYRDAIWNLELAVHCGEKTRIYSRTAGKGRIVETLHCDNPGEVH